MDAHSVPGRSATGRAGRRAARLRDSSPGDRRCGARAAAGGDPPRMIMRGGSPSAPRPARFPYGLARRSIHSGTYHPRAAPPPGSALPPPHGEAALTDSVLPLGRPPFRTSARPWRRRHSIPTPSPRPSATAARRSSRCAPSRPVAQHARRGGLRERVASTRGLLSLPLVRYDERPRASPAARRALGHRAGGARHARADLPPAPRRALARRRADHGGGRALHLRADARPGGRLPPQGLPRALVAGGRGGRLLHRPLPAAGARGVPRLLDLRRDPAGAPAPRRAAGAAAQPSLRHPARSATAPSASCATGAPAGAGLRGEPRLPRGARRAPLPGPRRLPHRARRGCWRGRGGGTATGTASWRTGRVAPCASRC
jgi:hypothetical protein